MLQEKRWFMTLSLSSADWITPSTMQGSDRRSYTANLIYLRGKYTVMSPRRTQVKTRVLSLAGRVHGLQASRDRWRMIQSAKHHQRAQLRLARPHQSSHKSATGMRHTPHSHPHGVELGPHTDKPSPIRFRITIKKGGLKV
jgi:hypothetical protein